MFLPPLAPCELPSKLISTSSSACESLACELSAAGADGSLLLTIAPSDESKDDTSTLSDERLAAAADWSLAASRQARGLVKRGMTVNVAIPAAAGPWPTIDATNGAPPVGRLIRPLFCDFEPRPELKPFQRDGVKWLLQTQRAILADDMGLGKTVQVVEAIRTRIYRNELRTAVVLCPRTLGPTWDAEVRKWAPELTFAVSTSWQEDNTALWQLAKDRVHVLILHYDALKSLPVEDLQSHPIGLLVLDEAHRVRRSEASVTGLVRGMRAENTWAVSGTPIERDTEDLATLLSVLHPARYTPELHNLGEDALRAIARPLLLRRERSEVLTDLPSVDELVHRLELTVAQQRAYKSRIASHARNAQVNSGDALALIGDLLTICDADPATGASSKLDEVAAGLKRVADMGEQAIVFSYKLGPLNLLEERLTAEGIAFERVDGRMTNEARAAAINSFRSSRPVTALIASSRVASEGLTLTEANHVFFVNRWWNPSSNNQARDRVVRIGQERPVTVHTYICSETLEERLEEILESKSDVVDNVINALSLRQGALAVELAEQLVSTTDTE